MLKSWTSWLVVLLGDAANRGSGSLEACFGRYHSYPTSSPSNFPAAMRWVALLLHAVSTMISHSSYGGRGQSAVKWNLWSITFLVSFALSHQGCQPYMGAPCLSPTGSPTGFWGWHFALKWVQFPALLTYWDTDIFRDTTEVFVYPQ